MNSVVERYRRQRVPSPSHCEPKPPPCSTCGQLECLCRPRFFAGQILTADDLNRLDHYIRGKHRLHNRQLHGWGVVNGLEVTCDACGPGVAVSCGYALSPCGEDIVVCDPVVVDVCALIQHCKGAERAHICDPPRQPSPAGCDQGEQEWILAIRYSESPTRAVKPLMPSTSAGCGCGGGSAKSGGCGCGSGGGGGGGCGCGGNGGGSASSGSKCGCGTSTASSRPRGAPVQCEPTVICEGFEFAVYRKPPEQTPDEDDEQSLNPDSELAKRFRCCTELLFDRAPQVPGEVTLTQVQANPGVWADWACRFKDYLQRYVSTRPGYNCALQAQLAAVSCPSAQGPATVILQTAELLLTIWLDAVLACLCSALLPPCPSAHPSDLVPLASVRVSGNPCRVLSICNWTVHRKFATTYPALQYWLSVFPFGKELRQLLDAVCCMRIEYSPPAAESPIPGATNHMNMRGAAPDRAAPSPAYERARHRLNPAVGHPERLRAAAAMTGEAYRRAGKPLQPRHLFESVLLPESAKGDDHLSKSQVRNLPQFLALNSVLLPMVAAATPGGGLGSMASMLMAGRAGDSAKDAGADVAQLRKELAGLRADLKAQAEEIARLRPTADAAATPVRAGAARAAKAAKPAGKPRGKGRKEK